MEKSVGIRELKQNPSEVVSRVKAGEQIVITERGRPVAKIVPISLSPLEELIASGKVIEPTIDIREAVRQIVPLELGQDSMTSEEWLKWSRGDE
jgi:prevent-host-death family protein